MRIFEVGKKYAVRSICDSEVRFEFEVVKRTAQRVTILHDDHIKTVKIFKDAESERCAPLGKYSFSPVLRA